MPKIFTLTLNLENDAFMGDVPDNDPTWYRDEEIAGILRELAESFQDPWTVNELPILDKSGNIIGLAKFVEKKVEKKEDSE